jgi:hypothetical protein
MISSGARVLSARLRGLIERPGFFCSTPRA